MNKMSKFSVRYATSSDLQRWDDFVQESCNGTLFHTRRFLEYHGNKFIDVERFIVILNGQQVFGLLNYRVESKGHMRTAISPYGGSYGGIVLQRAVTYSESVEVVRVLMEHFKSGGYHSIRLTHPLACLSREPLDTLYFSLMKQGFRVSNRDVSSVVELVRDKPVEDIVTSRARNMYKKAAVAGVSVVHRGALEEFWPLMEETFSRHNAKPTHDLAELRDLTSRIPERIYFDMAYIDRQPVAGVCVIEVTPDCATSFYLVQSEAGRLSQSQSMLLIEVLERYKTCGFRWFDFGLSTYGMEARDSVFRFKESFGARGWFRETMEWSSDDVES